MRGTFFVKRLNKTGNYVSVLDKHPCFVGKDNPEGLSKEVVQPIFNSNGEREIRYMKVKGGYIVSGEAYILTGHDEKEIDEKAKKYKKERWENLTYTLCNDKKDLW